MTAPYPPSQQKADAERVRDSDTPGGGRYMGEREFSVRVKRSDWQAASRLAAHILAEADEGPVDEAWLASLPNGHISPLTNSYSFFWSQKRRNEERDMILTVGFDGWTILAIGDECVQVEYSLGKKTRDELRRLLAALEGTS